MVGNQAVFVRDEVGTSAGEVDGQQAEMEAERTMEALEVEIRPRSVEKGKKGDRIDWEAQEVLAAQSAVEEEAVD